MKLQLWVFYVILVFHAFSGLVTTMFLPGLDRPARVLTASFDAVMVGMALLLLLRHRASYTVRLFVVFCLAATVTVLLSFEQLGVFAQVNGLRQGFFFLSTLVVLNDILTSDRAEEFTRWMTVFLIVFALAQIPTSVWQYVRFGAGDAVGGTYGTGGGSGMITQLLFLVTFYLLVHFGSPDDGMTFSVKKALLFSLLLIPCALNETKIAFPLLVLFILLLVGSRKKTYKAIPILAIGGVLFYLLSTIYSESVKDAESFLLDPKFYERYLMYDARPGIDIPRFAKITLMFRSMGDDITRWLFGFGYGLFAGENILGRTAFARSFWYFTGTRPMVFTIWIQGGLIALTIIGAAMVWSLKWREPLTSTERRLSLLLWAVLGTMWFYNEGLWNRTFAMIVSYLMLWISYGGMALSAAPEEEGGEAEEEGVAAENGAHV